MNIRKLSLRELLKRLENLIHHSKPRSSCDKIYYLIYKRIRKKIGSLTNEFPYLQEYKHYLPEPKTVHFNLGLIEIIKAIDLSTDSSYISIFSPTSEIRYDLYRCQNKLQKEFYYNSESELRSLNILRRSDGFVFGNPYKSESKSRLQVWRKPNLEKYKKHENGGNREKASIYIRTIDREKIEKTTFLSGIGFVRSEDHLFIYKSFTDTIGIHRKKGNTNIIKVDARRIYKNRAYRIAIHGYPVAENELRDDLGTKARFVLDNPLGTNDMLK